MAGRNVILHYHLFKNAGTSVDAILRENVGEGWQTAEFPTRGWNNTALVEDWLRAHPGALALSSHTLVGPLPQVEGVTALPVMFFRDPLTRIRSAYLFERRQDADTRGARIARENDLAGYVRARLDEPNDRMCRNFHTERLSTLAPGPEPETERATAALERLTLAGLVERFSLSMELLAHRLRPLFPGFSVRPVHLNRATEPPADLRAELGPALHDRLLEANAEDLDLLDRVERRLTEQALAGTPAAEG